MALLLLSIIYLVSITGSNAARDCPWPRCQWCTGICCCAPSKCGTVGNVANGGCVPETVDEVKEEKSVFGAAASVNNNDEFFSESYNENETYFMVSSNVMIFIGLIVVLLVIWNIVLNVQKCKLQNDSKTKVNSV